MRVATYFLASLMPLFAACKAGEQPSDQPPNIENLTNHPAAYEGQEVAVDGRVDRVLGSCALRLTSGAGWLDDDPIFTVCKTEPPLIERVDEPSPRPGDRVQVAGTVTEMTRVSYERKAAATVDEALWGDRETMPVLMAVSVVVLESAQD